MPLYRYKPVGEGCADCFVERLEAFDAPTDPTCRSCAGQLRRVIGNVSVKFRRSFEGGYRPDLARFRNDPEAYVSGPLSLRKLIDRRKADGWVVGKPGSAALVNNSTTKDHDKSRDLLGEAHEEAKGIVFRNEDL